MFLNESTPVLGNFFRLTYVENAGIAFGINFEGGPPIFAVARVVALGVVIWYLWSVRNKGFLLKLSLALILGGAVGNLADRIMFAAVADFLDFDFPDIILPPLDMGIFIFPGFELHRWPVFNVADSAISIGILLYLYMSVFGTRFSRKTQG